MSCKNLQSLRLPAGLESIGESAMDSCTALRSLTIPAGVRRIEDMTFRYCTGLEDVTLSENVTGIGQQVFEFCTELKRIVWGSAVIRTNDYDTVVLSSDLAKVSDMLETKNYHLRITNKTKYPVLFAHYRNHPDPELRAYLKSNFKRIFQFLLQNNDVLQADTVLQIDGIIPDRDIMQKAVDLAIRHTQEGGSPELQMLLLRYQEEHFTREPKILRL